MQCDIWKIVYSLFSFRVQQIAQQIYWAALFWECHFQYWLSFMRARAYKYMEINQPLIEVAQAVIAA